MNTAENNCYYVSSRGLMKSCDIKSSVPCSSNPSFYGYNFNDIQDGSVVYICNTAIPNFIRGFETLNVKIVLVSGDSDTTVASDLFNSHDDFLKFIESDKIIKWFSQNCITTHPKMVKMPIGLDYHSNQNITNHLNPCEQEIMMNDIKNNSKPFDQRMIKAYSNFHFLMTTRYSYDRKDAITNIPENLVYYEPNRTERREIYTTQSEYAFVISPFGNGYDCHRTWEALILGCIPVVKTSGLDEMYKDLPVLILQNWSDLTQELMEKTVNDYKTRAFNYDKLTLNYWTKQFRI
jgi:hypothetical protein